MSVLIKGMKIPKCCTDCCFCDNDLLCVALEQGVDYKTCHIKRRSDCPLVEIPTPHGDLIDMEDVDNAILAIKPIRKGELREAIRADIPIIVEAEANE